MTKIRTVLCEFEAFSADVEILKYFLCFKCEILRISSDSHVVAYLYYYRRRVCVFAKFDQFLPVRSHFDTKRPVNFFHVASFQSATFGRPLFAFVLCVLRQKIIKRTESARKAYRSA